MDINKYLIFLFSIDFFERALFGVIVPFFPLIAKEKHLNEALIGLVFALYSVGGIFSSLISHLFKKTDKIKLILTIFILLMGISVILFGLTKLISNLWIFLISTCLLRFNQGMLSTLMSIFTIDIININLSNNEIVHQRYIMYFSIIGLIGNISGSSLGSFLFIYFGFIGMFVFLGLFLVFTSVINQIVSVEFEFQKKQENEEIKFEEIVEENEEKKEKENNLIHRNSIKNYFKFSIIINFILMSLGICNFYSIYPSFSLNMKNNFKLDKNIISLIFSSSRIIVLFIVIINAIIPQKINFVLQFNIGIILQIIGLLLIPPITQIGIPKQIWIVILGLNMGTIGLNLTNNSIVCIFIQISKDIYGENGEKVINVSAIYLLIFNVGELFGPLLGGLLSTQYGFNISMLFFSSLTLIIYLIYLFFYKIKANFCS